MAGNRKVLLITALVTGLLLLGQMALAVVTEVSGGPGDYSVVSESGRGGFLERNTSETDIAGVEFTPPEDFEVATITFTASTRCGKGGPVHLSIRAERLDIKGGTETLPPFGTLFDSPGGGFEGHTYQAAADTSDLEPSVPYSLTAYVSMTECKLLIDTWTFTVESV